MQNECTPPRQAYSNVAAPYSTDTCRQNIRRRQTLETPIQGDFPLRYDSGRVERSSHNKFTSNIPTRTSQSLSPAKRQHDTVPSELRDRNASRDIFSDEFQTYTPQLRDPTIQFRSAARRLVLKQADVNNVNTTTNTAFRSIDSPDHGEQTPAKACNFSRKFPSEAIPVKDAIQQTPYECDITSARREGFATNVYGYDLATPVKCQKKPESRTPASILRIHQPARNSLQRTLRQSKNFSRPIRMTRHHILQNADRPFAASPKYIGNKYGETQRQTRPAVRFQQAPRPADRSPTHQDLKPSLVQAQLQTPRLTKPLERLKRSPMITVKDNITFDSSRYVEEKDLTDRRRQLKNWQIWLQRMMLIFLVLGVNLGLALAYFRSPKHPYLLGILVFMKSKDILSTIADLVGAFHYHFHRLIWPPKEPDARWILSLICAYAETEEQIMKTVTSLATNFTAPHRQVICIILDGMPRDILSKMDTVMVEFQRPYVTWRGSEGQLRLSAGFILGIPIILICKVKNAGKKDSLLLGHDLFNFPRKDMPHSTKLLREEIRQSVMPRLVSNGQLTGFDFVFCTDADSTIHERCLQNLANALCQTIGAIAGCGTLFAEFTDGWGEYSPWHLFQQFQYTFGQYVRRQAESTFGRVTCLPGCVTMIVVRPELGDALSEYAKPVTGHNLFRHQVQYLGTDRRLTWCMLSQNKHLRTIFVPDASSETVTPASLSHYLSQRRRWASNAYFNDFFYLFGRQQRLGTRLFAAIDIVRLTMVFYRVFNTVYFIHGLALHFYIAKIIPTLIVTKTPATWFLLLMMIREPLLRRRIHKILLGMIINQIMSPILSVIVFANVLVHVGSQAWGKTGASTQGKPVPNVLHNTEPLKAWTPKRLAQTVREAIQGLSPGRNQPSGKAGSQKSMATVTNTPRLQLPPVANEPNQESASMEVLCTSTALKQDASRHYDRSTSQQTPARKLFQNVYTPPTSIYRRTPYRRNDTSVRQQNTPTRNVNQQPRTEFISDD